MDTHQQVGQAGCKANVEYYKHLRQLYSKLALDAYSQEKKWEQLLNAQKDLLSTLETLSSDRL